MHREASLSAAGGISDIRTMLRLVRQNLGLDVAFIGEFVGERRVFRHVDAAALDPPIREGDDGPLSESYCARVVDGRLPELIPDTGPLAEAQRIAATRAMPVGAHLSVPIRLSNGMVYGTFCCFGHTPDHSLNERDLALLRTFAGIVAQRVDRDLQAESLLAAKRQRIRRLIEEGGPAVVYQPVFLVEGLRPAGSEALARFPVDPHRSPETWFADAREVGLQTELEFAAIRNALTGYAPIWRRHRVQLGINAAPGTILTPGFEDLLEGFPVDRLVLELTEHERIDDYGPLGEALGALRARGVRIAVDDVGAGYASMSHIVAVRPNIMKLDRSLVQDIDRDPMRAALAEALVGFAAQFECRVVAEGVETPGELAALKRLRVQAIQGYLLGRPGSVESLARVLDAGRPCLEPEPALAGELVGRLN